MNKLIIEGIETNSGIYIRNKSSYHSSQLIPLYFDEVNPINSEHINWCKIDKVPVSIKKLIKGVNINFRYEILDESFVNDVLKKVFIRDEVAEYDDEDYVWIWKSKYSKFQSLYKLVWDISEDSFEEVEFEYIKLMKIDNLPEITKFSYPAQIGQWRHEGLSTVSDNNIIQQELDKIIFPSPLMSVRPCKLSSKHSYDLVREYIKTNIDSKYAEITSDYNFCFTVKKKIHLDSPVGYEVDINNNIFSKRKRKPKYVTQYRKSRSVTIFEMTSSNDNYKGYTVLKGFEGTSHKNLAENIENYLTKLINEINKPLVDCPHCKGLGVTEFNKINTNE